MKILLLALMSAWVMALGFKNIDAAIAAPEAAAKKGFSARMLLLASGVAVPTAAVSSGDPSEYNFEADVQGWIASGSPLTSVTRSPTHRYAGAGSLAVRIDGTGSASAAVTNPDAKAGQIITYRVFVPSDARITAVQPFVLQNAAGNWTWTGNAQPASALKFGEWNTITVQVPEDAAPLSSLGVQFTTNGDYEGTVYVDSVNY